MNFMEWMYKKDDWQTNDAINEMEEAWNAAIDEAINSIEKLIKSHIKDVGGECSVNDCDYIATWTTAVEEIKRIRVDSARFNY